MLQINIGLKSHLFACYRSEMRRSLSECHTSSTSSESKHSPEHDAISQHSQHSQEEETKPEERYGLLLCGNLFVNCSFAFSFPFCYKQCREVEEFFCNGDFP